MLPEVGATEWLIIAIVALIVIGPKDLPVMMRRLGQFVAKLRGMANEFRSSFDEMARQSELEDLRKEVEAMRRGQFADMAAHDQEMRSTVSDIEQSLSDVGVQLHPPMSYQFETPEPPPPPVEIAEAPAKPARASRKSAGPKAVGSKAAASKAAAPKAASRTKAAKPKATPTVETPKARKPRTARTVEGGS